MGMVSTKERNGARRLRWANTLTGKGHDAERLGKHKIDAEMTRGKWIPS
jgi:hypothetical protein